LACHAILQGAVRDRCLACHRLDAIGLRTVAGTPLTPPNPKAQAIHRAVGQLECATCHPEHGGQSRRTAQGRFAHGMVEAQLRRQCAVCHAAQRPTDAIHGRGAGDCGPCHTDTGWRPSTFAHDRYFRFDGHHPDRCTDCHTWPQTWKSYTCYGCHEHTVEGIAREHQEEGMRDIADCARCHRTGDEHGARRGGEGRDGEREGGRGGGEREGDD
jgi:hypothetical protein